MSICFDGGKEGDIIILNKCPECGRFIKHSSLPKTIKINGFHEVFEPLLGNCSKCGEVKLYWWRD